MGRAVAGLAAATALLGAAPSALAADHVYAGTLTPATPGSMPRAFVIETRGRKITRMTMQWHAGCDSGYNIAFHGSLRNAGKPPANGPTSLTIGRSKLFATPIAKNGRFKAVVYGSIDIGGGDYVASASTTISGVLRPGKGSGKARSATVIAPMFSSPPPADYQPDTCDSGALRWKVARGAGVFGGATSQGEPIAVTVRGGMVKRILVGWRADGCSGPGSWWDMADEVVNFDISPRGAFGASFNYSEDEDDGGKTVYDYDVRGQVAGKSMTGSFSVSPTVVDAAGSTTGSCSTSSVTWKARSA